MHVVTTEKIRELDRRAISEGGIPGVVLMENAGRAVVDVLERRYGRLAGKSVAVFCGSGNNGGDGFVIARVLSLAGAVVTLFAAEQTLAGAQLKPDSAAHHKVLRFTGGYRTEPLPGGDFQAGWQRRFDFAIDALLGTGINSAPRGWCAEAIRAINALDCPVAAVDIPSGIDADNGSAPGDAVRATDTVTFAYPKVGLLLSPGYEYAGWLHVSDIGFNWQSLGSASNITLLGCSPGRVTANVSCSPSLCRPVGWEILLEKRQPESNKGDYGHAGILAGSRGMVGAPALVARAAQRMGAGLVTVLTAQSAQPALATKLDEQMTIPLPDADGSISDAAWDQIVEFASKASVLCIGPGLTTRPATVRLVHRILREIDVAVVLDADGLNALAQEPSVAAERNAAFTNTLIMTPHPGEAARLLGTSVADVQSDRIAAVREISRKYGASVVLKGRYTLAADPGGAVCINTTGNPGMATGGMGDTLTGVIGALAAQNVARGKRTGGDLVSPLLTAALGVHAHGIAGDIAAAQHGNVGYTAGDVIQCLPAALARLVPEA